jgi:peptidase E
VHTHIVALGGGGFSEETDNTLLDDYILGLTGVPEPRVCFLATASGDAEGYVDKFHASFPSGRARASHFPVFKPLEGSPAPGARSFLMEQDVIYVGGGSTANLLSLWRLHGLDGILRDAWHAGVVLAGISAGMVCWFEEFLTDSFGGLRPFRGGLGMLRGSACPHYDDDDRRRSYRAMIQVGAVSEGVAAEGCVGLHYVDGRLARAVTSRPGRTAVKVTMTAGAAVELPVATELLR